MPAMCRPRKCTKTRLAPVETTIAPAKPSHVLPGLMRGINLCRPISEPTTYAPMSLNFVSKMK